MKKAARVFIYVLLGIVILVISYFIYIKYQIDKGNLVKWEGRWFTKEQLKEKFPPQYVEVPAKNTPEEVYAKFREALLKNDIEGALALIKEKNREDYRKAFKDEEKLDKWIKTLPAEIKKEREDGNYAYYGIDYGTNNKNTATFVKNSAGYWEIDQI